MYTPKPYEMREVDNLHALIWRHNFGTIFSNHNGTPMATLLPFLLEPDAGPHGTLRAHMARRNPQWRGWDDGADVLVVFLGPHAYISPGWYENPVTVPTWNYAAVQVHGTPRLITAADEMRNLVEKLVRFHESQVGNPWDIRHADPVMEAKLRGIVGFEIPITRIDGQFKFDQDRPAADRAGVIRALECSSDPRRHEVADIMRDRVDREN
jgi:transcriptional regulator